MADNPKTERDLRDWQRLYSELDTLIKQGQHEQTRAILNTKNPRKVPREFAVQFGELAFRAHLPLFTLKVLHPFIYPENRFSEPATEKEKIIYATAIFSMGAVQDSLAILNQIDSDREPEGHFYKALAYVCDWNYAGSIPHLKAYIGTTSLAPYRKLVGKLNLAAAHVLTENWLLAAGILEEIKIECVKNSHMLLLGNCFELEAQLYFYQGSYDEALELLEKSASCLKDQQGRYSMLVDKGIVLCQLFKSGQFENIRNLKSFQIKARELGHWDSIRETDLFEAIFSRNDKLLRKIIMGTPSEWYRQRVRKLYGANLKLSGKYLWYLGDPDQESQTKLEFDPYSKLYEKPLLLKTFDALTCDFYKPSNLGFLFQKLYPDEKFNPFSSPPRILQLLKRLDAWFTENQIPLRVVFKKSEFQLTSTENIFVSIQRGKPVSSMDAQILKLKGHFDGRSFSPTTASIALAISKSTIHKVINEALADGRLTKTNSGRGVAYRFSRQTKMRKAA